MEEKRIVVVKVNEKQDNRWITVEYTGRFHWWGSAIGEDSEGPFTVGVVELDDGTIKTAMPEDVRFIS